MGFFDKIKKISNAVFTSKYDIPKKIGKIKNVSVLKTKFVKSKPKTIKIRGQGIRIKFTEQDINKMRKLRAKGFSLQAIGEKFNTSKSTARTYCIGINPEFVMKKARSVYNRVDSSITKQVIRLRKQNLPLKEIGHRLGIGQTTAWTICNEAGLKNVSPRKTIEKPKGRDLTKEIIRLRKGGMSAVDVSKKLHVGKNTVYQVVPAKQLGYSTKKSISQSKINQIRSLREQGLSMTEIQKQVGVGGGTIWKYCHDIKVLPKAKTYQKRIIQDRIAESTKFQKAIIEKKVQEIKRINGSTKRLVNQMLAQNKSIDEIKQSLQNMEIEVSKDTLISYSQSSTYKAHIAYLETYKLTRDDLIRKRHQKAKQEGRELIPEHDRICPFCNKQSTMDKDEFIRKLKSFGGGRVRKHPRSDTGLKRVANNKHDETKLVIFDEQSQEPTTEVQITFPEDLLTRGVRAMDGVTEYPKAVSTSTPNNTSSATRYMDERRYNCVFCEYRGNTIELKNHMEVTHKDEMTNFVGTFRPDADKNPPYS